MNISYHFIPMGSVVTAAPGKIYIDVGNDFAPGLLDHHHATAPETCTAVLALNHSEYILSQTSPTIQLITHLYPDLDAISGIYFARAHLESVPISPHFQQWADYVCHVDRGETVLNPAQPITPYSLFIMRLYQASQSETSPEANSLAMLEAGLDFIENIMAKLAQGQNLTDANFFEESLQTEIRAVSEDWERYLADMKRAELFECALPVSYQNSETNKNVGWVGAKRKPTVPLKSGGFPFHSYPPYISVPALWIEGPSAILFKAWARGDAKRAKQSSGFIFTGIQINPQRAILSVMPDSGVNLKGLGAALEIAETKKREKLGEIRQGQNRPGYDSPDPWYDGRSPLHAYTIVDAPHQGSILTATEIRAVFEKWLLY